MGLAKESLEIKRKALDDFMENDFISPPYDHPCHQRETMAGLSVPPCPACQCGSIASRAVGKKAGALIGTISGAASGISGALSGAINGAEIGATLAASTSKTAMPFGLVAGAVLGGITGAIAGCAVGTALGEAVDDSILHNRACLACGRTFHDARR